MAFACDYLDHVAAGHAAKVRNELLPIAKSVTLDNVHETSTEVVRELISGLTALVGRFQIEQMHYVERSSVEDKTSIYPLVYRQTRLVLSEVGGVNLCGGSN